MDERDKIILQHNTHRILEQVTIDTRLKAFLIAGDVLRDDVLMPILENREGVELVFKLIKALLEQGDEETMGRFLDALRQAGQGRLAQFLEDQRENKDLQRVGEAVEKAWQRADLADSVSDVVSIPDKAGANASGRHTNVSTDLSVTGTGNSGSLSSIPENPLTVDGQHASERYSDNGSFGKVSYDEKKKPVANLSGFHSNYSTKSSATSASAADSKNSLPKTQLTLDGPHASKGYFSNGSTEVSFDEKKKPFANRPGFHSNYSTKSSETSEIATDDSAASHNPLPKYGSRAHSLETSEAKSHYSHLKSKDSGIDSMDVASPLSVPPDANDVGSHKC